MGRISDNKIKKLLLFVCSILDDLFSPLRPSIKLQILLLCFHIFLTEVVVEKLLKYQ